MKLQTACPHCAIACRVTQNHIGKTVRCPSCTEKFVVAERQRAPDAGVATFDEQRPTESIRPKSNSPGDIDTKSATETHGTFNNAARAGGLTGSFGRYQIVRQLGKGGMGVVYLAEDASLDRKVAIKIPFIDEHEESTVLDRFQREARAIAQLHHPSICPVHEVSEVDGIHYLAMAYIDGKSLTEFASPENLLPINTVLRMVGKLAMALDEAHAAGVIHRDIKPDNLMLNHRNEPIILDFGLAQSGVGGETRLTQAGQLMGTPAYMPPEQVNGDLEALGPSCDIYSLGMVLYHLLCGRLPFTGSTLAVLSAMATKDPPPLMDYRSEVDPVLDSICQKALRKDPADRYSSMREFANALAKYVRDRDNGNLNLQNSNGTTEAPTNINWDDVAKIPLDVHSPSMSGTKVRPKNVTKQVEKKPIPLLFVVGGVIGAMLLGSATWLVASLGGQSTVSETTDSETAEVVDSPAEFEDAASSVAASAPQVNQCLFDVLWVKSNKDWVAEHDLEQQQIAARALARSAQGYIPCRIAGYTDASNKVRFAVVWERGSERRVVAPQRTLKEERNATSGDPIWMDAYYIDDVMWLATVRMVEPTDEQLNETRGAITATASTLQENVASIAKGYTPGFVGVVRNREPDREWAGYFSYYCRLDEGQGKFDLHLDLSIDDLRREIGRIQSGFRPFSFCSYRLDGRSGPLRYSMIVGEDDADWRLETQLTHSEFRRAMDKAPEEGLFPASVVAIEMN